MKIKRTPQKSDSENISKKPKYQNIKDYFQKTLEDSGILLNEPPNKCVASYEAVVIIRNLKKNLQRNSDYPRNMSEFYLNLQKRCEDLKVFKHYLFPNIVRISGENSAEFCLNVSLFKILLSLPILQRKLMDYIFEKAIDLAADSKCGPWIQMILKCFSSLDSIADSDKMAENLINLLDVTSEKMVRLEIITAIPDIIGDQAHDNITSEMSRILSEDHDLIPAILDCLSYLCLSDEQYAQLQKKTLNILKTLSKCSCFPNFVKFLLMPRRTNDGAYLDIVVGLRNALGWPTSNTTLQDIASSQILTASAIRNSIISSKVIANAWIKLIANCKINTDHAPIDLILIVILYSTTEEKQKQIENIVRKQIKLNILNEELLEDAFEKFKPILKDYLKPLICLTNSLLKTTQEPLIQQFASHMYSLMFSKLFDCCQTVAAELLQLGLDSKQCVMSMLTILNNVAQQDIEILKSQSIQMLTLLDRMDDMTLSEVRAVMNLVCALAYSIENSVIRDDIHMIVRKELGSSNPVVKIQGILAGIHAVKYLMGSKNHEDQSIEQADDSSMSSINHLPEGDIRDAAQIMELISRSTRQFPDMIAFFYDELCKIVKSVEYINIHFLNWMTDAVTNDLQQNFIVYVLESEKVADLKLTMQYCINSDSEMDETIAINIAGLTLKAQQDVSIIILSSLFQLVQALHLRKHNGDLSSIDALLGCSIIMPHFDIELIDNMSNRAISNILDCQVHCANWFRELLNAFASQTDPALKLKIYHRIFDLKTIESLIGEILIRTNISYKPPLCNFSLNNINKNVTLEKRHHKTQNIKSKTPNKLEGREDSVLPQTLKSQANLNTNNAIKNKLNILHNIHFRHFNLELLNLLNGKLTEEREPDNNFTIEIFNFLLKYINNNLENILISKIKKKTFLSKHDHMEPYCRKKAEECAQSVIKVLPKVVYHMKYINSILDEWLTENDNNSEESLYNDKILECFAAIENIFNMYTIHFKWIGFKSHHKSLLKNSLRIVANIDSISGIYMQDLLLSVAKYLQGHEKYCVQLTTAVALIENLKAIQEYSSCPTITKILRDLASKFLSKQWKTADGNIERGLLLNQSIDNFAREYFIYNDIADLKSIILLLINDIQVIIKNRNSYLESFQSINKANFPILYRNLGNALFVVTKTYISKGLTNDELLDLWKDVVFILKCMSEITKVLDSRNNLTTFFKKSLPIIKLFIMEGIPILELEFKNKTQEILEILKTLQLSTRFLQSLCCHSRLKQDTALINKVPFVKQLLETLLYKVKALLAANNCSEAFWMGNLKNKNIHGEVISSQQSEENEDTNEDCDEQLPDDDSDETDDEILDPESRSVSDIV
ncbi:unnamed protein product, partial [Brenthis ino]